MRLRDERGAAFAELAIVAPALMLLILGVLQFGLWYHAQNVVRTAAQEAARWAAAEDGSEEQGRERALQVVRAGLGNAADHTQANVSIDPELARVSVVVEIRGLLPIPGLTSFHLKSSASVYRERFRPIGANP